MLTSNLKNLKEGDEVFLKKTVTLQDLLDISLHIETAKSFLSLRSAGKPFIIHNYGVKNTKVYVKSTNNRSYYYLYNTMIETKKNSRSSNHFFTKMFLRDESDKKI